MHVSLNFELVESYNLPGEVLIDSLDIDRKILYEDKIHIHENEILIIVWM